MRVFLFAVLIAAASVAKAEELECPCPGYLYQHTYLNLKNDAASDIDFFAPTFLYISGVRYDATGDGYFAAANGATLRFIHSETSLRKQIHNGRLNQWVTVWTMQGGSIER